MSKTIYEATLSEALPDSISRDSSAQAVCAGIDPQIRAMSANLDVPAWMSRVQTMSSDELDHVAYTFGSHVWMKDWSLAQKRAYIVEVVARKKIVGTPAAIIDVFTQLGYAVRYEDCMTRFAMEPGTFLVSLVNEPVPSDDQWQMRWIVDNIKPASRTWRWDNRIEARHTARAVAAFTGCLWHHFTCEVAGEEGLDMGGVMTLGEDGTTSVTRISPNDIGTMTIDLEVE
jgi:phage tail P2-like protein